MKNKIYTLLLLIVINTAFTKIYAQTEIDISPNGKTYSQLFDSLSTGLIPARIPYGVLYDRVYNWNELDTWNTGDTTSLARLYQAWYDAEQSVIDSTQRPHRYDAMRKLTQQQINQNKLPLLMVDYRFAYFDSTASDDGRLTINNGRLIENNNASPYLTKQIAIAGIAQEKLFANKTYTIQYDTALLHNNTLQTMQSIIITNVTTGATYNLSTTGTAQTILFTQAGINTLKYSITLSGGTNYINYQTVHVAGTNGATATLSPTGPLCDPLHYIIESAIPFKGYDETVATNSYADYHIYYHTQNPPSNDCERVLRKPIIIMDGFDPQDSRDFKKIYNDQLKYNNNGIDIKLGDDLRDKGYDVIILNFPKLGSVIRDGTGTDLFKIPTAVKVNGTTQTIDKEGRDGGTDYMERNAFLLVQLIQNINITLARNGSTEKLVIIGPSMGGQISRYALAYMEKQQSLGVPNMNHNTRLFLSFDSPNDGANIPVALGQNLDFFGNFAGNQDAKDSYNQRLHSVAARQLLIEQLDGLNSTAPFHQTFFNNIRSGGLAGSGGYPVNLRKVTLLNGNGTGIKTYTEGIEVLNLHGLIKFLGINILVFIDEDNFMPATGTNIRVARTRLAQKKPIAVYNGKYYVTNNNNRGSMDAVQGSTFDATNAVYTGFSQGLTAIKAAQNLTALLPNHCFIPSVSALAFKNSNFNWNNNVTDRNLLCNNEIYFDGYFIPKTNEGHITLTTENVNWLTQEIDKGQPNCPTICTNAIIGGANTLCLNDVSTYTLDFPIPAGYTLLFPPGVSYQVLSSSNTSVTIKSIGAGFQKIKGIITNPCGANIEIFSRTINFITLAAPNVTAHQTSGPGEPTTVQFTTSSNPIATYNWYVDNISKQSGPDNIFDFYFPCRITKTITCKIVTNCGTSAASNPISITGGCIRTTSYSVSPNPASNTVNVYSTQNKNSTSSQSVNTTFNEIRIFDLYGKMKKFQTYSNMSQAVINISDLISGIYFIEITDGSYKEKQQLIIQK